MPRFDEWEHGRQMAKLYREKYPPGTRMVLLGTTEERDPVPIGMRGTVHLIDDQGHNGKFRIMLSKIRTPPFSLCNQ